LSTALPFNSLEQLWPELWASLASVLRSYSAVYGLSGKRHATIENGERVILARHGSRWLELKRDGKAITWRRDDGNQGALELTETGRIRSDAGEEEMDMAAEAWAQELMR
jgi:hypothetical protein